MQKANGTSTTGARTITIAFPQPTGVWLMRARRTSLTCRPPHGIGRMGRTATLAARALEEERWRPKVLAHLGDEASLGKLVFTGLSRVSEYWGKK